MGFGVGIGAFVQGFSSGVQTRAAIDEQRAARKSRKALEAIDTDAKKAFDAEVAQGNAQPDEYETFWRDYALPKRVNEMLRQGDIAGARALEEWGQSDAALKGGRLFARSLVKAQTGDVAGAMDDAIAAAKTKGYIEHGYELKGKDEIVDEAGKVIGYRLTIADGDREFEQDVAVADVPKVIATFANPIAAWESQVAARDKAAADTKAEAAHQKARNEELTDYETKKKIDRQYDPKAGGEPGKDYADTYADMLENDMNFSDMSEPERDAKVRAALQSREAYVNSRKAATDGAAPAPGLTGAAPSAPAGNVIVDTITGNKVENSAPAAPGPVAPAAPPTQSLGIAGMKDAAERQKAIAAVIQKNAKAGTDPVEVRSALAAEGVSEDEFRVAAKSIARPISPRPLQSMRGKLPPTAGQTMTASPRAPGLTMLAQ